MLRYVSVSTLAHSLQRKAPGMAYFSLFSGALIVSGNCLDHGKRLDNHIEELASQDEYKAAVKKLCCFIGVKTHTALSVLVEVGDFKRFANAQKFAAYLGLVPGENTSGDDQNRLGITKAGNRHVRLLLTETAQSYARGHVGYKSKELKARQAGNSPEIIAYADKANERLRRRYCQGYSQSASLLAHIKAALRALRGTGLEPSTSFKSPHRLKAVGFLELL